VTADASSMTVETPAPRDAWDAIARSDPSATATQSVAFRDAILASGQYRDMSRLYSFPSGTRVIMPLTRRRGWPSRLAIAESWSADWGFCGPICEGGQIAASEAAAVLQDVARLGTLAAEIRLGRLPDRTWLTAAGQFTVDDAGCYVLDLDGGFEEVWQHKFRSGARRAVRKAEQSTLKVDIDRNGQLLSTFYGLYETSIHRWAAMQHEPVWLTRRRMTRAVSPSVLALVAKSFGDACTTWVARLDGEPVASIITLAYGNCMKFWRGAMDKDLAGPVRANNLLHRLAIEEACQGGYRFYDMGYSVPGSSLARFKESNGASLQLMQTLRTERIPIRAAERVARTFAKRLVMIPRRMAVADD
jgi:hypothetical protein